MALITCPECGKQVSEKATNCPNCGFPISGYEVQTIEQTGKKFKKQKLYSVLLFAIGILIMFLSILFESWSVTHTGVVISVIGVIWFVIIEIKIWWHHK